MDLDIDFENWGYSDDERARARAAASDYIENANGRALWDNLRKIVRWYANSPYAEDIEQLLESFHDRLHKEYDLLPTAEDEALSAVDGDSAIDKKRLDVVAVTTILGCLRNIIPTGAIAAFADKVEDIADIANQYLDIVVQEDMLYRNQLDELLEQFAGVAGFADYFTGGDRSMRSDAVETLLDWYSDRPFVHEAFAESVVRGLEHDRRAGTLDQRLPWWRWVFDQIGDGDADGGFWRSVFAKAPLPFAQGFLHMVVSIPHR